MDESRKAAAPNHSRRSAVAVPAAVIGVGSDAENGYQMFETTEVSLDGAFLAGPILLEPDEQFTVELCFADGTKVRAGARVARVDHGPVPGLDVRFTKLSDPDRDYLAALPARRPQETPWPKPSTS